MTILDATFFALILVIVWVSYQYGKASVISTLGVYQQQVIISTVMWMVRNNFVHYTIDENGQYQITPIEETLDATQEKPDSKEES